MPLVTNRSLITFLGISRLQALRTAWQQRARVPATYRFFHIITVCLVGCIPAFAAVLQPAVPTIDLCTLGIGTAAVLALMDHGRHRYPWMPPMMLSHALSLIHTGVALGVIPAVITLLLMPSLPYEIQHVSQAAPGLYGAAPTTAMVVGSLCLIAAWSSFTEEIIFRGCILSSLRRATNIRSDHYRDYIAVVASGLLFGISHIPVWGPAMGLALSGFGIGLGIAYIAAGEALAPVILYHWGFNFLSLLAATFLGRIR